MKNKSSSFISKQSKNIMKNKYILYVVLLLSIIYILQQLYFRNLTTVGIFILTGFMAKLCTDNMIIILTLCLLSTQVYVFCYKSSEGMKNRKRKNKNKKIKGKEKFSGTIRPGTIDDDDEIDGSYIDKSSTIETAFSLFDNVLGGDGMKRLSDETTMLVDRQKQLIDSIDKMGPVMKNMSGIMNKLGGSKKIEDIQDKLGNIVKS